ncbi:MAG: hypothetical protein ACK493_16700 [Planctomycetota bacterium]|nr:hypothetical protein [Blastopirellula sp.]
MTTITLSLLRKTLGEINQRRAWSVNRVTGDMPADTPATEHRSPASASASTLATRKQDLN